MAKHYVFSTLACDQRYTNWVAGEGGVNIEIGHVNIKGGHGVANDRLITPLGVMTEIDSEQLAILEKNYSFMKHKQDGYIVVQAKKSDTEKVAADMNLKDPSAPLTEADFPKDKAA